MFGVFKNCNHMMAKSKKEEKALAELEEEFKQPDYKFEKVFSLAGILSAGTIMALAGIQLYNNVKSKSITTNGASVTVSFSDYIKADPITSFAPFFWTFSTVLSGFCLICAELRFDSLIRNFRLLRSPIGKGIFCLYLSSFYVNDSNQSMLYIANIIVAVLGILYISTGLFCKKKNIIVPE